MKNKVIISVLFIVLLFGIFSLNSYAVTEQNAVVTFKAVDSKNVEIENLEVSIYKVADLVNSEFQVTEDFKDFDIDDLSINNIELMKEYAVKNLEVKLKKITDENGEFVLNDLELRKIFICSK